MSPRELFIKDLVSAFQGLIQVSSDDEVTLRKVSVEDDRANSGVISVTRTFSFEDGRVSEDVYEIDGSDIRLTAHNKVEVPA